MMLVVPRNREDDNNKPVMNKFSPNRGMEHSSSTYKGDLRWECWVQCSVELQTNLREDYAKFYNHGGMEEAPTRAPASQFHVYLPWVNGLAQHSVLIVS